MTSNIVNQGKGTQPKVDRNKELARDYGKMPMTELVKKYDITPTRIYAILKQMGIKPKRK